MHGRGDYIKQINNVPESCIPYTLRQGDNFMKQSKHLIGGIHVTGRLQHALQVQQVLTEFSGNIKTRLGLHEVSDAGGGPNGVVLIEFVGSETTFNEFTYTFRWR